MTAADAGVTVVKDMAVTHREFVRNLARLLSADVARWDPARDGRVRRFAWGGGIVEVRLAPEAERRIAMLALPRTRVTLTFESLTPDEQRDFLAAFDLRFQRGGG